MEIQTTRTAARSGTVRQRIASADQPTHPVRRHLHAARQPGLGSRFKAFLRLRFRLSSAAA